MENDSPKPKGRMNFMVVDLVFDTNPPSILRAQWVSEREIIIWVLQKGERRDEP